jgi:CRP/FNR family transcriptional regulator
VTRRLELRDPKSHPADSLERMQPVRLPADVGAIVAASFLAELPGDEVAALLDPGYRVDQDPGRALAGRDEPVVALLVEGLVRVFLESDSGRQVTVRYARPGDALGLVHVLGATTAVRAAAVTRTQLWVIRGAQLLAAMETSVPLTRAVARECAARAAEAMEELALVSFGSVRARLARHLLDLAASQQPSGELVVAATQQQLADAVGSVREVVARALGEFRAEGVVVGADGGIAIVDAGRLDAVASRR